MLTSVKDLLSLCADELPEEVIKLDKAHEVKVRALKGSDAARVSSMPLMDQQFAFALPKGIVEPHMSPSQIQKFIDFAPAHALTLLTAILRLSDALGDEEADEKGQAEKN